MSKKDYDLLVAVLVEWQSLGVDFEDLVDMLSKNLKADNPRFSETAFRRALGMEVA